MVKPIVPSPRDTVAGTKRTPSSTALNAFMPTLKKYKTRCRSLSYSNGADGGRRCCSN